MPETADNVAAEYGISRADQDAFALRSQQRWAAAQAARPCSRRRSRRSAFRSARASRSSSTRDEHPRPDIDVEQLAKLKPLNGPDSTVTAGNASGVNDGAAALIVASEAAARAHGLTPRARVVAMAAAGVAPRIMGIGPVAGGAQGARARRA